MFERNYKALRKISLTPMIDMVFLLVVFFMLTTTFSRHDGITLDFGEASDAPQASQKHAIHIATLGDRKFELGDKNYQQTEFVEQLMRQIALHPEHQIILKSKDESVVQDLVTAMDLIRRAGGKGITVVE